MDINDVQFLGGWGVKQKLDKIRHGGLGSLAKIGRPIFLGFLPFKKKEIQSFLMKSLLDLGGMGDQLNPKIVGYHLCKFP